MRSRGWIERRFGVQRRPGDRDRADARLEGGDLLVRAGRARRRAAVAVPEPAYPVYERGALFAGAEVVPVPLARTNGWLPDLDAFDAWDEIALFWVCYPNNPTGATAPLSFYEELAGARPRARLPALLRRGVLGALVRRAARLGAPGRRPRRTSSSSTRSRSARR